MAEIVGNYDYFMVIPAKRPASSRIVASINHEGCTYPPWARTLSLVKWLGPKKLPAYNQHAVVLLGLASTVLGLPEPSNSPSRQVRITTSRGLPEKR